MKIENFIAWFEKRERHLQEMARQGVLRSGEKNQVNKRIHAATQGYHDEIPLQDIFDALQEIGVEPVQEDGTRWSGFLTGGGECGSDKAANQRVIFHLVRIEDRSPLNNTLFLSWCKMESGRYEITAYLS